MSVYYRALIMARSGVKIDLLTYGEGQDVAIPGVRVVRIPAFPIFGNIKTGPSVLKLFLDVFITLWTIGLLIRNRYDFVHAHEEAAFIAVALKPIFRYRLIYDMHSSLPEQLRNFGWSKSRLLTRFFEWAEDGALKKSDAVITICPALAEYATERIDDGRKHFLIENSIFEPVKLDEPPGKDEVGPDVDQLFAEIHAEQAEGIKTLLYAGTLETYQGIDLLLQSMAEVRQRHVGAFLFIVGGSENQVRRFQDMANDLEIGGVTRFISRVPQSVAKQFNAKADILLSPRTRGMNTPLKVYEQLASGKPLVATRIPSHTQVLTDDVAFLGNPDPSSYADQIALAVADPNLAAAKAGRARELYDEAYSPAVYEKKIDSLLRLIA
jgi:glycosyltransferase involved in cell wall biosynthesis